jgi:alpha-tubulin suppressor-like RCC1 family protein
VGSVVALPRDRSTYSLPATRVLHACLWLLLAACEPAPFTEPPAPERPPPAPAPGLAAPAEAASTAPVIELAAGEKHTCALHGDGRVSCWGSNRYAQLGIARVSPDVRATPVAVPELRDAVHISASEAGTCALRRTGELMCWGLQAWPHHGGVLRPQPTRVNAPPLAEISGSCARSIAGGVSCFTHSELARVLGVAGATALSAMRGRGCAVVAGGSVACWADETGGERVAAVIPAVADAVQVAVGSDFACARRRGGGVHCWGKNRSGQLGRGSFDDLEVVPLPAPGRVVRDPVHAAQPVVGIRDAVAVAAGEASVCAIRRTGDVACWGLRSTDTALSSAPLRQLVPAVIDGVAGATAIAAYGHTCVVRGGRDVACWGRDEAGQLGNGWWSARTTPIDVPGVDDALGVDGSCALRPGGRITCWPGGEMTIPDAASLTGGIVLDRHGGLWKLGQPPRRLDLPPAMAGDWRCAVTRDGGVTCTAEAAGSPTSDAWLRWRARGGRTRRIPGVSDARAVADSAYHACVLHASGRVSCLFGEYPFESDLRRWVPDLSEVVQLTVSELGDCALRADRSVWCWQWDLGPYVGNTTAYVPERPSQLPARRLTDVISLAGGAVHGCAVRADGSVWCWGDAEYSNRYGELGDGTVVPHAEPAPVLGIHDAIEVSVGSSHSCAWRRSGAIACWGDTQRGAVGTFATAWIGEPQAVRWR